MYDATRDPYCYEGTTILKNLQNLRNAAALDMFEKAMTDQRADEPLPEGRFSVSHYKAVHRHLFQDVYAWAGKFRTVRLAKGQNAFCYPEHIGREMRMLFASLKLARWLGGLAQPDFAAAAAAFLSKLNAIHPFREGNGRTQLSFLAMLADRAGHPLDLERLHPERFLDVMIKSFRDDDRPLVAELFLLTVQR